MTCEIPIGNFAARYFRHSEFSPRVILIFILVFINDSFVFIRKYREICTIFDNRDLR